MDHGSQVSDDKPFDYLLVRLDVKSFLKAERIDTKDVKVFSHQCDQIWSIGINLIIFGHFESLFRIIQSVEHILTIFLPLGKYFF